MKRILEATSEWIAFKKRPAIKAGLELRVNSEFC